MSRDAVGVLAVSTLSCMPAERGRGCRIKGEQLLLRHFLFYTKSAFKRRVFNKEDFLKNEFCEKGETSGEAF